jgi:hypothetical protein
MDTEPLVRDEPVTLNGLRFHYRDWGDPTALPGVMLNGFMGTDATGTPSPEVALRSGLPHPRSAGTPQRRTGCLH